MSSDTLDTPSLLRLTYATADKINSETHSADPSLHRLVLLCLTLDDALVDAKKRGLGQSENSDDGKEQDLKVDHESDEESSDSEDSDLSDDSDDSDDWEDDCTSDAHAHGAVEYHIDDGSNMGYEKEKGLPELEEELESTHANWLAGCVDIASEKLDKTAFLEAVAETGITDAMRENFRL
ncbi:hypothetical protein K458DRAFT_391627 [Lentithecium fluviatile CBS 122367]|uniref:Uncharacterized protein n=1 Tax=Lentithecium fluviatile CBS 122367 TaxID=1168545 RepID=A0A6G1ITV5_9PLEO|nr:hypothetical protein K458DRAFT_391627 [Lentithecium fluviatile CBS 122367]